MDFVPVKAFDFFRIVRAHSVLVKNIECPKAYGSELLRGFGRYSLARNRFLRVLQGYPWRITLVTISFGALKKPYKGTKYRNFSENQDFVERN